MSVQPQLVLPQTKRPPSRPVHFKQTYPPVFGMEMQSFLKAFKKLSLFEEAKIGLKKWKPLSQGENGTTYLVTFLAYDVIVPAVLKKSTEIDNDNLMYEYRVGLYLNPFCSKFPCFVYTYGLYTNLTLPETQEYSAVPDFKQSDIEIQNYSMRTACDKTVGVNNLCLLTQYVQKSEPLSKHFEYLNQFTLAEDDTNMSKKTYDLWCILFQIYYTLGELYPEFEHNDLNANNVLVKELNVEIKFTFLSEKSTPVVFKSKYLAKIIDYGRCNYSNSVMDIKEVCEAPNCSKRVIQKKGEYPISLCGEKEGFKFINFSVLPDRRQEEIIANNYKPDSFLLNEISLLYPKTFILPANIQATLFKQANVVSKREDRQPVKFLIDPTYKTLLGELAKLIGPDVVEGEFAELIIDGVNDMKFIPCSTPIDSPYDPKRA
jgi:hypothetical protein